MLIFVSFLSAAYTATAEKGNRGGSLWVSESLNWEIGRAHV